VTPHQLQALQLAKRAGFDAVSYLAANPDLQDAGLDADRAAEHFILHGASERRQFPLDLALDGLRHLAGHDPRTAEGLMGAYGGSFTRALASGDFGWLGRQCETLSYLTARGRRPYVLLGDSHSALYRRFGESLLPLHHIFYGGSARGLGNRQSRTAAGAAICEVLRTVGGLPVFIQFGQVDVEFVYSFKRIASGSVAYDAHHYRAFALETGERYVKFLAEQIPAGDRRNLTVLRVFPPALSDAAWRQGYVNAHIAEQNGLGVELAVEALRSMAIPSLSERTAVHRTFNSYVEAACRSCGIRVAGAFDELLAGDVLDLKYVPQSCGADHHLEYAPTDAILSAALLQALKPA
jgi:hypothetical protein